MNTIEDLMFLFGSKKKAETSAKWERIRIEAENAWYDGKDADANPHSPSTLEYNVWYRQWLECNKNL